MKRISCCGKHVKCRAFLALVFSAVTLFTGGRKGLKIRCVTGSPVPCWLCSPWLISKLLPTVFFTGPRDFLIGVSSLCNPFPRISRASPLPSPSAGPDTEPAEHWVGGGRGQGDGTRQAIGPWREREGEEQEAAVRESGGQAGLT